MSKIKTVSKKVLNKFGFELLKKESLNLSNKELELKNKLLEIYTRVNNLEESNPACECVIFSMDRAFQLHSLLASYFDNMVTQVPVHIIYRSTSAEHEAAYQKVFGIFKDRNVVAIKQESKASFKPQLLEVLLNIKANKVFFLVDDIVFKDRVDILELTKYDFKNFIPSLKMGNHLTRCAVAESKDQPLPEFKKGIVDEDKLCWVWSQGELDWGYPLSVDGHIFLTKEIMAFIEAIEFATPNTLEGHLNFHLQYFHHRYGVSFKTSKIINLPLNRVTTEALENYFGNVDAQFLLKKWQEGFQMDYKKLNGYLNIDVHEDVEINFIKRS